MKSLIQQLAAKYQDDCVAIRHHLHAHPELSFEEHETSRFIQEKLKEWGISFQVMAGTGVVGWIEGTDPLSRITALRADMDALPIQEENDVEYRSLKPGVMHACGHDVHTTCLLGAARILQETRDQWRGSVKLIFQPGEEKNPGGASIMIREGVLDNPAPQRIFGMHVHPLLPSGTFSFRGGKVMASADEIYITVKVKGGHAAAPHLSADSILIASQIVLSLQQIVSRNNNPLNPTVLSITSIQGGNTTNVIPSEVKMMGTLRAMDETWRFKAHQLIKDQVETIAAALGGKAEVHIDIGYPFVLNNEDLTEWAKRKAAALMGEEKVEETELRMGAEDFAFYSHRIPACFFRLGVGTESINSNVHTPTFNIDEQAIQHGVAMMAWLAIAED
ncbi:MAG TPA: M20 family metallopeptidase [Ferruginibacter sp.]|nr:amidohydrolase [Ferruginibacter sp.]HRN79222.1 M20 family metallopeptidase [Ferruginibacter sp.]HRO17677.1 M20 family metallopeptidase [Ferruginibacter sp.]HRQ20341.1 M20 family metallopeptidase [Ferruginibacter sp.]